MQKFITKKVEDEYTEDIKNEIKIRNRQYQRNPNLINKNNLDTQNSLVNILLTNFHANIWEKRINKVNEKKENVWKELRSKKRNNGIEVPILKYDEQIYVTEIEKANIFAEVFNDNGEHQIHEEDQAIEKEVNDVLQRQEIEEDIIRLNPMKIKAHIRRLRPYKAPGKDGIQRKHFKKLRSKLVVQLYCIYQACLRINYFPDVWKESLILPILKPGKKSNDLRG